ncbi:MAG: PAS domain-containing protein [Campylobacterales bacterium]|nr:PAS domain-containing protein [Campylobacterales bacterium]
MRRALTYRLALLASILSFVAFAFYVHFVQQEVVALYEQSVDLDVYVKRLAELIDFALMVAFVLMLALFITLLRFIASRDREHLSYRQNHRLFLENRFFFEHATVGFLVCDAEYRIVRVNETVVRMLGTDQGELIGAEPHTLFVDSVAFAQWSQQAQGGRERFLMHQKGRAPLWVEVSGVRMHEQDGVWDRGVLWSVVDVSDEMHNRNVVEALNRELQESVIFLRSMINIAPVPIYVKDEQLRYRECNAAFLNLLELKKGEVIGRRVDEIHRSEIAESINRADLMMRFEPYQHYIERFNFKSKQLFLEFHKVAINHEKQFKGIVGVIIDVTHHETREIYLQQRVEEEMMQKSALEQKHMEERLYDAKFAAIGKLAAGITHEINTPLTYIKGNAEMLALEMDDIENSAVRSGVERCHRQILEGVMRIENIVASMREVASSSNEAKVRLNLFETLMTALVMGYNRIKHIVGVKIQDQLFTPSIARNLCVIEVNAQRQRLEQVWIIIINNALDVLEQRGAFDTNRLELTCSALNGRVTVRFKDNGGGIDEKMFAHLFDPFVSGKTHGGIGIGLNIAQRIIHEHEGTIRAYNEEDGAVFEVSLPLA